MTCEYFVKLSQLLKFIEQVLIVEKTLHVQIVFESILVFFYAINTKVNEFEDRVIEPEAQR